MKHSRWLTGVAAVLAVSMQTASQSLSERVEQKIEQHLGDIPSAAYAVVDADDLLASGAVNRPGKNATKHTRFRIGSLTKSFTAVCVLMLQDEGLLSVDDDVTEHLPDYPALEGLTIHDLLIHRSGLLNFTEIQQPPTLWTPEDVLGFVMTRPNWRTPDTSWRYCNTNYIILGLIVERVSGEDYGDFLKERVFDRLGMDRMCKPCSLTRSTVYRSPTSSKATARTPSGARKVTAGVGAIHHLDQRSRITEASPRAQARWRSTPRLRAATVSSC